MSYKLNAVEVLQPSSNNDDYVRLPAAVDAVWNDGDFLKFTSNEISKYAPADTTEAANNQQYIVGISSGGKKAGETKAVLCKKAIVLMPADSTNNNLGAAAVIVYDFTSKYSVKEGVAYNAAVVYPQITLTLDFATYAEQGRESDGKIKVLIDGDARLKALN